MMTDERLAEIDKRLTELFENGGHEEMSDFAEGVIPDILDEITRLQTVVIDYEMENTDLKAKLHEQRCHTQYYKEICGRHHPAPKCTTGGFK